MLDLEFFKIRNLAIAPYIISRIDQTRAFLQNELIIHHLVWKCLNYYLKITMKIMPIFSEAFTLALTKFEKHTNFHSALPLFRAIQCFNPQFIQASLNHHNLATYRIN